MKDITKMKETTKKKIKEFKDFYTDKVARYMENENLIREAHFLIYDLLKGNLYNRNFYLRDTFTRLNKHFEKQSLSNLPQKIKEKLKSELSELEKLILERNKPQSAN